MTRTIGAPRPARCRSLALGVSRAMMILVLAACGSPASAAERIDNRAVLKAVCAFADAMDAGDRDALRELIHVGQDEEAQRQGREAYVSLVVAQKRLEHAADARFAGEGERFHRTFGLFFTALERKELASARIERDDVSGVVIFKKDEVRPLRMRLGPDGQWQVVLDLIDRDLDDDVGRTHKPDPPSEVRIKRLAALADAFEKVSRGVEQGELATADAAGAELVRRIAGIEKSYRDEMDTLPERFR